MTGTQSRLDSAHFRADHNADPLTHSVFVSTVPGITPPRPRPRHHAQHRDTMTTNNPGDRPVRPVFVLILNDAVIVIFSGGQHAVVRRTRSRVVSLSMPRIRQSLPDLRPERSA